jgi:hypothetical protein
MGICTLNRPNNEYARSSLRVVERFAARENIVAAQIDRSAFLLGRSSRLAETPVIASIVRAA